MSLRSSHKPQLLLRQRQNLNFRHKKQPREIRRMRTLFFLFCCSHHLLAQELHIIVPTVLPDTTVQKWREGGVVAAPSLPLSLHINGLERLAVLTAVSITLCYNAAVHTLLPLWTKEQWQYRTVTQVTAPQCFALTSIIDTPLPSIPLILHRTPRRDDARPLDARLPRLAKEGSSEVLPNIFSRRSVVKVSAWLQEGHNSSSSSSSSRRLLANTSTCIIPATPSQQRSDFAVVIQGPLDATSLAAVEGHYLKVVKQVVVSAWTTDDLSLFARFFPSPPEGLLLVAQPPPRVRHTPLQRWEATTLAQFVSTSAALRAASVPFAVKTRSDERFGDLSTMIRTIARAASDAAAEEAHESYYDDADDVHGTAAVDATTTTTAKLKWRRGWGDEESISSLSSRTVLRETPGACSVLTSCNVFLSLQAGLSDHCFGGATGALLSASERMVLLFSDIDDEGSAPHIDEAPLRLAHPSSTGGAIPELLLLRSFFYSGADISGARGGSGGGGGARMVEPSRERVRIVAVADMAPYVIRCNHFKYSGLRSRLTSERDGRQEEGEETFEHLLLVMFQNSGEFWAAREGDRHRANEFYERGKLFFSLVTTESLEEQRRVYLAWSSASRGRSSNASTVTVGPAEERWGAGRFLGAIASRIAAALLEEGAASIATVRVRDSRPLAALRADRARAAMARLMAARFFSAARSQHRPGVCCIAPSVVARLEALEARLPALEKDVQAEISTALGAPAAHVDVAAAGGSGSGLAADADAGSYYFAGGSDLLSVQLRSDRASNHGAAADNEDDGSEGELDGEGSGNIVGFRGEL